MSDVDLQQLVFDAVAVSSLMRIQVVECRLGAESEAVAGQEQAMLGSARPYSG